MSGAFSETPLVEFFAGSERLLAPQMVEAFGPPAPLEDDFGYKVLCQIVDGIPTVMQVTVTGGRARRGVRDRDLMSLFPLDQLAWDAFMDHATPLDDREARELRNAQRVREGRLMNQDPQRLRELLDVATVYKANIGRAPLDAVVEQLHYSKRTAGRRVREAADLGFLPETVQGRKRRPQPDDETETP